jgi:hypothetical protein
MKKQFVAVILVAVGCIALTGTTIMFPAVPACAQERKLSYAEDIEPIFKGWCVSCHQPGGQGQQASGLDLTSYDGLMKGTKFGPMVIPKEPDASNLIALVDGRTSPQIRMPYGHKPLPACLRSEIWSWIFEGAENN